MRTQAISKPRGEGPSPSFSTAPRVLPCEVISGDQSLSWVDPPLRNLTHHWLTGQAQGQAGWSGQWWHTCQGDKLCLLSGLWCQFWLSLNHGVLQPLKPGRVVANSIVFHCINIPRLFYPLTYWRKLGLSPDLGYCCVHRGAYILSNWCFRILRLYSQNWHYCIITQFHF